MFKKYVIGICSLLLVGLVMVAASWNPSTIESGLRILPHPTGIQPWMFKVENPKGVTQFSVDNWGRINTDNVIVVDSISKMTNMVGSSAGTGVSVVKMLWGKKYIIDPHAIANSFKSAGATAYFSSSTLSGITMILPYTPESGTSMYNPTTVELRFTGTTGWVESLTGNTPVTIWSPIHPGATSYVTSGISAFSRSSLNSGMTFQSVGRVFQNLGTGSGESTYGRTFKDPALQSEDSGASIWGINKHGESYTFEFTKPQSGVSVTITGAHIVDTNGE